MVWRDKTNFVSIVVIFWYQLRMGMRLMIVSAMTFPPPRGCGDQELRLLGVVARGDGHVRLGAGTGERVELIGEEVGSPFRWFRFGQISLDNHMDDGGTFPVEKKGFHYSRDRVALFEMQP